MLKIKQNKDDISADPWRDLKGCGRLLGVREGKSEPGEQDRNSWVSVAASSF